jgi:hypothetical protein
MLFLLYLLIVALLAVLVVRATLRGRTLAQQATGGLVLVVLLLRVLLIK